MIKKFQAHIPEFDSMKKYPKEISYIGNIDLLSKSKISIIGTRKPNQYTRHQTYLLAKKLTNAGICIVSGAAMGVDAISHTGAGVSNTIAVVANGVDIRYPAVNKELLKFIENSGLVISQFNNGFKATKWSFVVRNELVVALGDILIVTEADINSGSMRSVEYALKMGKEIYVLPHRLGESMGTSSLVSQGLATPIYDIDLFVSKFGKSVKVLDNPFLQFCANNPTFDEAVSRFGDDVYEAELEGIIMVENGLVLVV